MKLLKKLYEISSPSGKEQNMCNFIKSLLKGMSVDFTEDKVGNIYAIKGESDTYPCVVCHTDEVHKVRNYGYRVVESGNLIFAVNDLTMEFEGIGADDKNGIWVCLKALSEFDVIKCAFFVSEEVGCIGSSSADMKFFDDCRFVLQCDRNGKKDFIINASGVELCSPEFIEACKIHEFGYEIQRGLMTDVMTLKEQGLSVSACNISCGYYNPHSDNEMTNINDLYNCYNFVKSIIERCTDVYLHEPVLYDKFIGTSEYKSTISKWFDEDDLNDYYSKDSIYAQQTEFDEMCEDMYYCSLEMEDDFKLDDFIASHGEFYPNLTREDYEYACQDIYGCIMN